MRSHALHLFDSVIIELPTIYDTDNYLATFSPVLDLDNSLLKRKPIMGLIREDCML